MKSSNYKSLLATFFLLSVTVTSGGISNEARTIISKMKQRVLHKDIQRSADKKLANSFEEAQTMARKMNHTNPDEVLCQAQREILEQNFEEAFALIEWYLTNADRFQPYLKPVKLSMCLLDFVEVAKHYPAAMASLKGRQLSHLKHAIQNKSFADFLDFQQISLALGEENTVYCEFKKIIDLDERFAQQLYPLMENDLIARCEWNLCGRLIPDPIQSLNGILESTVLDEKSSHSEKMRFYAQIQNLLKVLRANQMNTEFTQVLAKAKEHFKAHSMQSFLFQIEEDLKAFIP